MQLGRISLNQTVHLQGSDRDWGWGELSDAPGGSGYSVNKLLWAMITESDNTATNMLIRLVGRAHVNQTMRELGLTQTVLGDYIRSDGDIRSLRTSPGDMAKLLGMIAREQIIDPWSCHEMIAIMAGQHHNTLIPAGLPKGLEVAHKTGTLHDTLNDVGIVFMGSRAYVIAVMTTHLADLDAGRSFIRSVSRLTYGALSRLALTQNDTESPVATTITSPAITSVRAPEPPDVQMWTAKFPHPL